MQLFNVMINVVLQQAGSITGAAAQTLVETAILALAAVLLVALA